LDVVDSVLLYLHLDPKDGMDRQDSVVDFIRKVMEGRDNVRVKERCWLLCRLRLHLYL